VQAGVTERLCRGLDPRDRSNVSATVTREVDGGLEIVEVKRPAVW
jgi:hypothetical protein